ncbi:hypothetical protein GGR51DRAFT_576896 [Nemania sp. FL0031]|nr:hypothetical protein GGR51DRAFT_576896 [Nemania sp. FL0031]
MSTPQVTSPSSPLTSFPQFPKLPTELRLFIWELAMEEGQTITLFRCPPNQIQRRLTIDGVKFSEVPVFFFVNSECRGIAAKKYLKTKITLKPGAMPFSILEVHLLLTANDRLTFNFNPYIAFCNPEAQSLTKYIIALFGEELMCQVKNWANSRGIPHDWDERIITSLCIVEVCQREGTFEILGTNCPSLSGLEFRDISKVRVGIEVRVVNLPCDKEYYATF